MELFIVGVIVGLIIAGFVYMFWGGAVTEKKSKDPFEILKCQLDIQQLYRETARVATMLNTLLKHLELEYVPEKESKEPAKVVKKKTAEMVFRDCVLQELSAGLKEQKPKRKYTKRKNHGTMKART